LRIAILETAPEIAACSQCHDRLEGKDAVTTATVGDHFPVWRKLAQAVLQLGKRDVECTWKMSNRELILRTNIKKRDRGRLAALRADLPGPQAPSPPSPMPRSRAGGPAPSASTGSGGISAMRSARYRPASLPTPLACVGYRLDRRRYLHLGCRRGRAYTRTHKLFDLAQETNQLGELT